MRARMLLPLALIGFTALAACDDAPEADGQTAEETTTETDFDDVAQEARETGDALLDIANNVANDVADTTQEQLGDLGAAFQDLGADVREAVGTQYQAMVADLEDMRDQNMSEAEKRDAVANARSTAEGAARTAGLSQEKITNAGDAAEETARRVLGLEEQ